MMPYDLNVLGKAKRPYFAARFLDDHVEVEGVSDCLIGEKIPRADAARPDGLFVEWHWDGCRLVVRNDYYGFSPLFYACYGNAICISPNLEQALSADIPRDLDCAALSVMLRMGHPVGDDTPFLYVSALPPGSTLIWEQGQLQLDAPELPIRKGPYAQISFDEAADQFAYLFDQAIRKRLPKDDNIVFPLSGGRDSRHILFALEANGRKPKSCVTLEYRPPATNEDARIAGLISKKADYQPEDYRYFKKSVEELWVYLFRHTFRLSELLRKEYLYPKVVYDMIKIRNQLPWYLIKSVFCIELEKFSKQRVG